MSTKESKLKEGEFEYGDVEMTDEEYAEAQNPKVRTTIFLEADLIRSYKKEATKRGVRYQQLMRDKLWEGVDDSHDSGVKQRLERLEKKVFKKR